MLSPAYSVVLAVVAAAAAGLVGAFALMKKTVLAGDVMSHIAIPGLGLAIVWRINPLIGGGLTLFLGIFLIARLEKRTSLSTESAIGVMFASSVAIGALLIHSDEALIDALFGGFGRLTAGEFAFGMAASLVIIATIWATRNSLIISLFSRELAGSIGINVNRADLVFLLVFGLAILSSLRFLGALLAGSLIILPASAARQFTDTLGRFLVASALISVLAMGAGLWLSDRYGLAFGPIVVVVAAAIFVLSLFKRPR